MYVAVPVVIVVGAAVVYLIAVLADEVLVEPGATSSRSPHRHRKRQARNPSSRSTMFVAYNQLTI